MRDRYQRLVPGNPDFTFNFAQYELTRTGGSPATLARLLKRLNDMLTRSKQRSESFWENLFFDFTLHGGAIAWLAKRDIQGNSVEDRVTVEDILDVIVTSPLSQQHAASADFKKTPCWRMLKQAQQNVRNASEARWFDQAGKFWLRRQVLLGSKARGAAVQQCSSTLSPFLLEPLRSTVCAKKSTFTPDLPLKQRCFVVDAPISVHGVGGLLISNLIYMMVAEEASRVTNPQHYTAIFRDELGQLIADPEFDMNFQSTCRSQKVCCVSSVQSLPQLQSALGGDAQSESYMKGLLANYVSRFLLANNCPETNQFWSDSLGEHRDQFVSTSEQQPHEAQDFLEATFGTRRFSYSTSEQLTHILPPSRFQTLSRGGPDFGYCVSAYYTVGGRTFAGGLPYRLIQLMQR